MWREKSVFCSHCVVSEWMGKRTKLLDISFSFHFFVFLFFEWPMSNSVQHEWIDSENLWVDEMNLPRNQLTFMYLCVVVPVGNLILKFIISRISFERRQKWKKLIEIENIPVLLDLTNKIIFFVLIFSQNLPTFFTLEISLTQNPLAGCWKCDCHKYAVFRF